MRGVSSMANEEAKDDSFDFYSSEQWRSLRYKALRVCKRCAACGRSRSDGVVLHVDHIRPRSRFPHLELKLFNLQVLCADCNLGKGNTDCVDWRTDKEREALGAHALIRRRKKRKKERKKKQRKNKINNRYKRINTKEDIRRLNNATKKIVVCCKDCWRNDKLKVENCCLDGHTSKLSFIYLNQISERKK